MDWHFRHPPACSWVFSSLLLKAKNLARCLKALAVGSWAANKDMAKEYSLDHFGYTFIATMKANVFLEGFEECCTEELSDVYKTMFSLTDSGDRDTSFWHTSSFEIIRLSRALSSPVSWRMFKMWIVCFAMSRQEVHFAFLRSSQHRTLTRPVVWAQHNWMSFWLRLLILSCQPIQVLVHTNLVHSKILSCQKPPTSPKW